MVSVLVVPFYLFEYVFVQVCMQRSECFQLAVVMQPRRLYRIVTMEVIILPVQVHISDVFLWDVWLFKHMIVRLEVFNLGFRVKDPLIQQHSNVLDSCLFVGVLYEPLSHPVSVVTVVIIVIHVFYSVLNPRVPLLSFYFAIVQVFVCHLKLL